MPADPLNESVLEELGNEFSKRLRRGESPTIQEYTTRFPAEAAKRVEKYLTAVQNRVQVATKTTISKTAQTVEQPSSEPPREFGRYRIERTLGEGGMGAVYLAHDSQLDRKVALKTPKFSNTSDPTTMQRFYREARSAATLQHPNICPVYDVGEINGTHYISMAFIEGQPLSDLVKAEKQPPVANLLKVVRKVALALHEAHAQGLIHRDLKPANIMIDRRNEPIVMDFGLARQFGDEEPEIETPQQESPEQILKASKKIEARITMPGTVMGSPGYMAPEQLQGDQSKVGPTSDVYAMGVLLYELLTGELPFPGTGTLISVVNSVMSDPPPDATTVRSNLDPRIAAICRKAMSKNVADRYESMQAFALALTKVLKADAGGGNPGSKNSRARKLSPELVRQKEQYELARSLFQEGQFAGAVAIMEKMVSNNPESNQFAKWAHENIADARIKAEDAALAAVTEGSLDDDELWNPENEGGLPPKRKRKARRKKKAKSLAYTFLAGAAGAIVVVTAAIAIRNAIKHSQKNDSVPMAEVQEATEGELDQSTNVSPVNENSQNESRPKPPPEPGIDGDNERPARPRQNGRRSNGPLRDRLFQLDSDKDGRLTKKELENAPVAARGFVRRLMDQFDVIDGNKDGSLDAPEMDRAQEFNQGPGGRAPFRRPNQK